VITDESSAVHGRIWHSQALRKPAGRAAVLYLGPSASCELWHWCTMTRFTHASAPTTNHMLGIVLQNFGCRGPRRRARLVTTSSLFTEHCSTDGYQRAYVHA